MANEMANLDPSKISAKREAIADDGKKLRVGIIGTGWIAESHIVEYKKMPDVEIVAGAPPAPGQGGAFFSAIGV